MSIARSESPDASDNALPTQLTRGARSRGIALTSVSWSGSDEMALPVWLEFGQRFGKLSRGVGWWIGDWLLFGNARYGEKYVRAAKVTGYDPQSLMNMVYVASRFDISRRREKLSWSHHAELAALPVEEQERWLASAEQLSLSVRCMRDQLRTERSRQLAAQAAEMPSAEASPQAVCPTCGCRFHLASERPHSSRGRRSGRSTAR